MAARTTKAAARTGTPSIENRKARHEYFIDDSFEAGIALAGSEVKSLRQGNASLQDSYCQIRNGEIWLENMYIQPYREANRWNVEERRPRKLLVRKGDILRWQQKSQEKGIALIPLKLYFTRGWAKVQIGVARGKKQYDKRDAIKERDIQRDVRWGE
ncbi:MAG: SsrA-binding protein SmpB [Armatimonadetes bacterium]|nr:SsrA-binding protein SmpB [Armatimonadota bacterium]